jgi:hypothetical protein
MMNQMKIHAIIPREIIEVNQYSSTASGRRCRNASHNRIPTEKAIKQTKTFFNFAIGYQMAKIQIKATRLTISTAKNQ